MEKGSLLPSLAHAARIRNHVHGLLPLQSLVQMVVRLQTRVLRYPGQAG